MLASQREAPTRKNIGGTVTPKVHNELQKLAIN